MSLKATFIGHSSTLLEFDGKYFLTDPVFSSRVLWFKRRMPMQFDPTALPPLSAVLLSHPHPDHLDLYSFKYIQSSVPVIVPAGMETYVGRFINNPIIELKPWAKYKIGNCEICLVPAEHPGHRWPWPIGWKKGFGFVISDGKQTVYFAGDSATGKHFEEIGQVFHIDLALLPVSPCWPKWYYKRMHMNPDQALQAFADLKAKQMIPIHWGTFSFGLESVAKPIEWLQEKIVAQGLTDRVHILHSGESYSFNSTPPPSVGPLEGGLLSLTHQ